MTTLKIVLLVCNAAAVSLAIVAWWQSLLAARKARQHAKDAAIFARQARAAAERAEEAAARVRGYSNGVAK